MRGYVIVALLVAAAYTWAQAPDSIQVTHWVGPGQPTTYEDWIAAHPIDTTIRSVPLDTFIECGDHGAAALLVESELRPYLLDYIRQWRENLLAEGYSFILHYVEAGTAPEIIRDTLKSDYLNRGLVGAFLVGDIQPAWFEMWDPLDHGCWASWPIDFFYMNLNGTWLDTMHIGEPPFIIYDGVTGDTEPQIYVGRLCPPRGIGQSRANRISHYQNYFRKDDAYRHNTLRLPPRALCFVDDPWSDDTSFAWELALSYRDTAMYFDPAMTVRSVYQQELHVPRAWVSVFCHGQQGYHEFMPFCLENLYEAVWYHDTNPPANFYNYFVCCFCDYSDTLYNGGWALCNDSFCVGALGSTKTGSMIGSGCFYKPLGEGKTIGEAYQAWWRDTVVPNCHDRTWFAWSYGMTLLGDPFLRPVLQNDVCAEQILAPVGTIPTGTLRPQAQVRNLGKVAATFAVKFEITKDGQPYFVDSQDVAGLAPNATVEVSFASVTLVRGVYHTKVRTELTGDENPLNDSLTGWVVVGLPAPGWQQMADLPAGPKARCVKDGGALAHYDSGDSGFMFALKGNNRCEFYRYNPASNTWFTRDSIPKIGVSGKKKSVKKGSTLASADGYVYATKGNNTVEFWRYDPRAFGNNAWTQMSDVPIGAKTLREGVGAASVTSNDTPFVYLLKGSGTLEFYRYNTLTNTWETETSAPAGMSGKAFKHGSCICSAGNDAVYVLKGLCNEFYAYDVESNSWTTKAALPLIGASGKKKKVLDGAGIAPLAGRLYALKGNNTREFWYYTTDSNRWSQADTIPIGNGKAVKNGGALAYGDTSVWALKGNNTLEFDRFTAYPGIQPPPFFPPFPPPPPQNPNELVIASGDELTDPSWNSSGSRVAFCRPDANGTSQVCCVPTKGDSVVALTAMTGDCSHPVWGRKDSLVGFEFLDTATACEQIAIVPATGGTPVVLTSQSADHEFPEFTLDGTALVYEREDTAGWVQIFLVPVQGGAETMLSCTPRDHAKPQPLSSSEIVFTAENDDGWGQVYKLVRLATGPCEVALTDQALDHEDACVAAGSQAVTYRVDIPNGPGGNAAYSQIGLVAPGLPGEAILTSGNSDFGPPSITPGGEAIHAPRQGPWGDAICQVLATGGYCQITDDLAERANQRSVTSPICGTSAVYEREGSIFRTGSGSGGGGQSNGTSRLALDALMPNPAHGRVKVLWHIQRETRVVMKVYDITGKRVNTLINGSVKPGSYATVWNGTDARGRKLAGGVYFCTLETNDTKLNRKIVLTN